MRETSAVTNYELVKHLFTSLILLLLEYPISILISEIVLSGEEKGRGEGLKDVTVDELTVCNLDGSNCVCCDELF